MRGRFVTLTVGFALMLAACDSTSPTLSHPSARLVPLSRPSVEQHVLLGRTVEGGSYTLDVLSGANIVQVRAADLSGHLFRVVTPDGTALYPHVEVGSSHTVEVTLRGSGEADLTVELSEAAAWRIRFSAGMTTASVDMSGTVLLGFSALAGLSTLDITADRPHGDVTLAESGGVSTFAVHLPAPTAVSVHADSGAGVVSVFGVSHQGVAAGTTFSSGTSVGADRYTIDAEGGVSSLVVDAP